jgi:hypothetical protein
VRPEGLEPPAYWFEARNRRTFMSLALGTTVVQHCALLRVIKEFRAFSAATLVILLTASARRVGTKMGTVQRLPKSLARECGSAHGDSHVRSSLLCDLSAADDTLERTNG